MIEKTIELKQSWVAFLTLGHPNVVIEVFQQNGSEIDTRNRSLIIGDLA